MNIKSQKGITLVAEVITIVIFMMIIATITYSSMSSLQVRALNSMYADIVAIQERADNYYLKYGEAPVTATKIDSNVVASTGTKNVNDDPNEYYMVDFSKLLNVSLNNKQTSSDYYFINAKTLTVYYSKGVTINGLNSNTKETYYTLPANYNVGETAINVSNYQ